MISLGIHEGGPELTGSAIEVLLWATMKIVSEECGAFVGGDDYVGANELPRPSGHVFEEGSEPAINVVFYIPGSLRNVYDVIPRIQAARFSRKQKLLLVNVPVPNEIAQSGGSVDFVVDALHQAVAIAAETFERKKAGKFDVCKANAIIEKVKMTLLDKERFEEMTHQIREKTKWSPAVEELIAEFNTKKNSREGD